MSKNIHNNIKQPIVLVHGGADDEIDTNCPLFKQGVKRAARIGYETLQKTDSVLDAVQEAVCYLESDTSFNAGHGAVPTWDGIVEMDAAIMYGADLNYGCVSLVRDIYHPIALARRIMETSRHHYFAAHGARIIAIAEGFEILPEGTLLTETTLKSLEEYKTKVNNDKTTTLSNQSIGPQGTVGAVAIDVLGNVAAATSTGGTTGKLPGRIGDSPVLGAGTYADNKVGAISATGHGETIMRYNVASRILALIEYQNLTAQEASKQVLDAMTNRFGETAGVISIDHNGNVGIYFTSRHMPWAYQRGEELHFGVDKNQDEIEIIEGP